MRRITRFGLILLFAFCCLGAWFLLTRPDPTHVRLQLAETGAVEEIVANTRAGTVKACRRARGRASGQAKPSRDMASEEAVDRAITGSKAARADCEAAQATARVHKARIGVARAELEKTRLAAPFGGIVAEVSGELSEYVTPSPPGIPTPPALDLIDDSCYYISAPIDETDASQVRVGAETRVTLDAFAGQSFAGSVRRIAPYVLDREKQARTVEVEIVITDPPSDPPLLAGYSADVEIVVQRSDQVLRIPTSAVRQDDSVLLFDSSTNRLVERDIEIGLQNWDYTEVRAGLVVGEQVVLSLDADGVREGALATPEDEP